MTTSTPAVGAQLHELGLDADPGEPVGEEADGLVVGEVGLPHPALGRIAADPEAVALAGHGEVLLVDRLGAEHDAVGLGEGARHAPR